MVDAPAGLWVGAGRHLYLLDPTDGVVRRRVRLHGQVDRIAADVRYRFLFVAIHAGIGDGLPLEERDASTGVLIRRAHGPLDFGANSLTPVFRGVWVSTSTGNFGAAFFYREANLSIARHRTIEGMQGIATQYSGGPHLWVLRRQLDPILTCADPDSGRIQGTFRLPDGYRFGYSDPTTAVSIANTVYVGTSFGVLRIKPSLCRPGAEG